ncbi:membrane protein insertase YidC [Sphingopyxis indica]|uniref:membrane protein insertase YidC n=1 Tax=Sphingopyxis indica TaxID=436663 RepID=UPI00293945F9|nr:membrane protein insertase YidC [Sphingopyxis indica]WOF43100.1 membrane protein insertase YidC [Sphingopyxis indica]
MDDKRNLIAAILLSVAILLGWNFVADKFFPTPDKPDVTTTVAGSDGAAPKAQGEPNGLPEAGTAVPAAKPATQAIRPVEAVLGGGQRIGIETPALSGSINLVGARIDDITLTKYRQTVEKNSPPVRLFAPAGTKAAYFASIGWSAQGIATPGADTVWTASGDKLTPETPVTLSWSNGSGQSFRIEYSIDKNYLITAKQTIANSGSAPVTASSYALIDRLGKPTDPHEKDSYTIHVGPTGYLDGKSVFDVDYDDLDESGAVKYASAGWLGFTDKYWLAAIIPAKGERVTASISTPSADNYQTLFARPFTQVAPGRQVTTTSRIFAGAKEVSILSAYQNKQDITRLSNAIDWGWFEFFEVPIFKLLDWLFRMVGNFGVAIMLLTLIIRAAMFPVAQRQFRSMAQMRLVQPKMKALQERHKDDKPKMQQELMKLYKDEKINPLAGCLPIVIQIPIFYALYKVLMLTIEMRHQPFILWIKDLSAPDPLHILNLFGLLPFTPPSFLGIGLLALILGVTMWLQFRLNPQATDPVQQQVFKIMPWLFMFIMAPFAAGLLLYWITNNCLSIAQQQWMYRKYPQLKAVAAK